MCKRPIKNSRMNLSYEEKYVAVRSARRLVKCLDRREHAFRTRARVQDPVWLNVFDPVKHAKIRVVHS